MRRREPDDGPIVRFSPYAWAKLHFFCHHGPTEIGGFGITPADDLLCITDFVTVNQEVTGISVAFDDEAVADFFDSQVDAGRNPVQFARHWLHTHPGHSAEPSMVDEETFERVFGSCDWALMFILARYGKTYARLRFNVGPGGSICIPVEVDYSLAFRGSERHEWHAEYERNIRPARLRQSIDPLETGNWLDELELPTDEELMAMSQPLFSEPECELEAGF